MTNGAGEEKRGGCGKFVLIGCGALLILGVAVAIGGYFAVKGALTQFVEAYTATEPLEIPLVQMPEDQVQSLVARVDEFRLAVETGESADPLALTGTEINAILQNHPDFEGVGDKVYVTMEGDTIKGEISIPLEELTGLGKGRYVNGSGEFSVSLVGDQPVVFLKSLTVNDKQVPQEFMDQMGNENLAKDAANDPDFQQVFEKLQSIKVENGKLVITPKSP
jgi:hypothetical protein